jgi:hypothetical protein
MERLAEQVFASRPAFYVLFALLYVPITLFMASQRLLWEDEAFTLFLSTVPDWQSLIAALRTGGDQHPLSFYLLTRAGMETFGASIVSLRLPALVGFGTMCVVLYEIVRRFASPVWGVVAALVPLTFTEAYFYSHEARGYGMVLGFCSVALLSWLRACEGQRRALFLPVLGLSLCGAVGSHYYAILFTIPLGLGELHRTLKTRRPDVAVWLSISAAILPLLLMLPVLRAASRYSDGFWAIPQWVMIAEFLPIIVRHGANVLVFVLIIGALIRLSPERPDYRASGVDVLPPWAFTALLGIAALPLIGVVVAKTVTHAYHPRYVIATVIGIVLLVVLGMARTCAGRSTVAALAICIFCVGTFVAGLRELRSTHIGDLAVLRNSYALINDQAKRTIVIPEFTLFYRLSIYAPRELASRLVYVSDPALQRKHLKHGSTDRGMIDLTPWFPLHVVSLREFVAARPSFITFGVVGEWNWFFYELPYSTGKVRALSASGGRMVLSVDDMDQPVSVGEMGSYTRSRPDLGERWATLPKTGPPLCLQFFASHGCPTLD